MSADIATSSGKGVLFDLRAWVGIALAGLVLALGALGMIAACEWPELFLPRALRVVDANVSGLEGVIDTRFGDHDRDGTPDLLVAVGLPGVLAQVLSGRSNELLLTVAADEPE